MVATPFKGTIKFVGENGRTFQFPVTMSDVNNEQYVFPDGQGQLQLPIDNGNIYLTDIILSAAGVDTSQADVFANGKTTGEQVQNSANLATNQSRQFNGAPIGFKPGALIRFTQKT